MDNHTTEGIRQIIERHQGNTLACAAAIAQESAPYLHDIIDCYGAGSPTTIDSATAVAERLTDIAASCANHATEHYTRQLRSMQHWSDSEAKTLAKHWAATLADCAKVTGYAAQLPTTVTCRTKCVEQQRRLDALISRLSSYADAPVSPNQQQPAAIDTQPVSQQPSPQHRETRRPRRTLVYTLLITVGAIGIVYAARAYMQYAQLNKIRADYTEEAATAYIQDHANGLFGHDALMLYLQHMDSILLNPVLMQQPTQYPPLVRMDNLARSLTSDADIRPVLEERVQQRSDSLYNLALESNTIEAWRTFQDQAPSRYYKDSNERIDSLQAIAWSHEPTAWQAASAADDKESYMRYLDLYPQGVHHPEAEGCLIDLEVNAYRNRGKAAIQSIDRIASHPGGQSLAYIFNETDYDMEFLFSGPTSRKMSVLSGASNSVTLGDGPYRIMVIIHNGRDQRFSFTQDMESSIYSSSISISDG